MKQTQQVSPQSTTEESITFENIRLSGFFSTIRITSFRLFQTINQHGMLTLQGTIPPHETKFHTMSYDKVIIKLVQNKSDGTTETIFCGLIHQCDLREEGNFAVLELSAYTNTYALDIVVHSRSFQDKTISYCALGDQVLNKHENAPVLYREEKADEQIGRFFLQYGETDWEFLKRVASHLNSYLIPEVTHEKKMFYLGLPFTKKTRELQSVHYCARKNKQKQMEFSQNYGLMISDYDLTEYTLLDQHEQCFLGEQVRFQDKLMVVAQKETVLESHEAIAKTNYTLLTQKALRQPVIYNQKIQGRSVMGKVIGVKKNQTKLHLEFDKQQSKENTCWFRQATFYTGEGEKGWCGMPEIGDAMLLYFCDRDENQNYIMGGFGADFAQMETLINNAKVAQQQGVPGKSPQPPRSTVQSPPINQTKCLYTPSGQSLSLDGDSVQFSSQGGCTLSIADGGGIVLTSNNDIHIQANNVSMGGDSPTIEISSTQKATLICGMSHMVLDGARGTTEIKSPMINLESPHNPDLEKKPDDEVMAMIEDALNESADMPIRDITIEAPLGSAEYFDELERKVDEKAKLLGIRLDMNAEAFQKGGLDGMESWKEIKKDLMKSVIMRDVRLAEANGVKLPNEDVARIAEEFSKQIDSGWSMTKEDHYFRNEINRLIDYPRTEEEMRKEVKKGNYRSIPDDESIFHQYGPDGQYNKKYVSADGYGEAVYNKDGGLIRQDGNIYDQINFGTLNYKYPYGLSPPTDAVKSIPHLTYDVIPWGNNFIGGPVGGNLQGSGYNNTYATQGIEFQRNEDDS